MFEKLGWMILAKARGHEYKIVAYKHGVKHLHECIDHLMTELTEADRQHDLKVLKMEVEVLEDFIKKHL
jgi:hypothetical protein